MIDPKTLDIKIIDLGLCMTPAEEKRTYESDRRYEDLNRLERIRDVLTKKINKKERIGREIAIEIMMESIEIKPYQPNCVRKRNIWKIRDKEEFDAELEYLISESKSKNKTKEEKEAIKDFIEEFKKMNPMFM
jgi:hypothetical protein